MNTQKGERMTRKYQTIGLRRDFNLSDLQNRVTGLNNLLDDFQGVGTFVSEDLDAIRGLRGTRIDSEILSDLANFTVRITNPNGSISVGDPLVTLKDRVDNARVYTGEIPAYAGGQGLKARFIPSSDINSGNTNSSGSDIFNFSNTQIQEVFWENGYFNFLGNIEESFEDEYGGIQWEGYFSPSLFDPSVSVFIRTTGLMMFEFDLNDDGNWQQLASIYAPQRPITATSSNNNIVDIISSDIKYVAEGDIVNGNDSIVVESVNIFNNTITTSSPLSISSNTVINVSKIVGETETDSRILLPSVEPGKFHKIRLSFWFPDNGQGAQTKTLDLRYIGTQLLYPYLYEDTPLNPTDLEVRTFLQNILTPYTTSIGDITQYRSFFTEKPFRSDYTPKSSLSDVSNGTTTISFTANTNVITNASANAQTGNYIVPTGSSGNQIEKETQVKGFIASTVRYLNKNFANTSTQEVMFIDHNGFVDWHFANSSGNVVSVASTDLLSTNNIVITSNTTSNSFIKITEITDNTTFRTSTDLNLANNSVILIYQDRGLIDKSKDFFCAGVFGVSLANTVSSGNTIVVTDTTGVLQDQVVQLEGLIIDGTTITSVNSTSKAITLSGTNPILGEIIAGSTITIAPSGTSINKEQCVIPLDTAPPFIGTELGLNTNGKGIKSTSSVGVFTVSTNLLTFNTSSNNITASVLSPTFNRRVSLNGGNYYILATDT